MRWSRALPAAALCLIAACPRHTTTMKQPPPPPPPAAEPTLDSLAEGQQAHGFTAVSRYLDDRARPMGARFRHDATGFVFDLIYIESAPQAFVWVNTFPTSDKGEPHTQEHLLLGKGNKGRQVASLESMSLAESSAFTMQWRTCYHFHTVAGADVFWDVLDAKMSGLLEPDYSDEEIRREVRNFGVAEDPTTGARRLEEKGTVYNEMVRSFENPDWLAWHEMDHMLYGPSHPLALVSGGLPEAIRTMTPEDIRTFHHQSYHLANMGMVAAFPRTVELGAALARTDAILTRLDARLDKKGRVTRTEDDMPPPHGATPGAVKVVRYPLASADKPGSVTMAWPPQLDIPLAEQTLLQLFLAAVAGDETTNLYKKLIDSTTRTSNFGATGVWSQMSNERGHAIYVALSEVARPYLDAKGAGEVRAAVVDELRRLAALPDGDPEVRALAERLRGRITETRRSLAKALSSPPGFGFRGTGSGWMEFLHSLEATPGYDKSLTMRPELAWVEDQIGDGGKNIWRDYLPRWHLLDQPFVTTTVADPSMMEAEGKARDARARAELDRLEKAWGIGDDAKALDRFASEYDAASAQLEAAGKGLVMPHFIDDPPLTSDDTLVWNKRELPAGVPLVTSTFESMTGGTAGIAFDLHGVPEARLRLLGALSMMLGDVGVIDAGTPIPYDQVLERQRREILSVSLNLSVGYRSGRVELVARGSGNDPAETERALDWLELTLLHPDWRPENLPRIRDLVDQAAQNIRNRMLGAEEGWVNDPPLAWWKQTDPLLVRATSFLTRTHDLYRLRWMLRQAPDGADGAKLLAFFDKLAGAGKLGRKPLEALTSSPDKPQPGEKPAALAGYRKALAALPAGARPLAGDALKDLAVLLADIPDDSLAADWAYLCRSLHADLATAPTAVLAELDALRRQVLTSAGARAFAIGAGPTLDRVEKRLGALVAALPSTPVVRISYAKAPLFADRLRGRIPSAAAPRFVGLVNPNTQGGVHLHSAPGPVDTDLDDESLLRYLAGNLYTGHGAHSMFMKTWAAGLAYSNGLRPSLRSGRVNYYAERCPDLVQTLTFVTGELERAAAGAHDPSLAEYAIAESFDSRVAASFEGRGEAIAADLADGDGPDVVKAFRTRLLELRKRSGAKLVDELFARMPAVYGSALPGWKVDPRTVADPVYFVIGPAQQLDRWQEYLHGAVAKDVTLYRLYPRDFWLP